MTIECNSCERHNCNRKESKKRTLRDNGMSYDLSCPIYRQSRGLKRLMVEMAMWGELKRFNEIRNVSKLGALKLQLRRQES